MRAIMVLVCKTKPLLDLWENFISVPLSQTKYNEIISNPIFNNYYQKTKLLYHDLFSKNIIPQIENFKMDSPRLLVTIYKYTVESPKIFKTFSYLVIREEFPALRTLICGEDWKKEVIAVTNLNLIYSIIFLTLLTGRLDYVYNWTFNKSRFNAMQLSPITTLKFYTYDEIINELSTKYKNKETDLVISEETKELILLSYRHLFIQGLFAYDTSFETGKEASVFIINKFFEPKIIF